MATKYRLTLMSGVHPANNNEVGDFVDERTAHLVGSLLLAIDANYQPEYRGYDLAQVTDERLPPNYRYTDDPQSNPSA